MAVVLMRMLMLLRVQVIERGVRVRMVRRVGMVRMVMVRLHGSSVTLKPASLLQLLLLLLLHVRWWSMPD